jgi:putative addiction module component (TIGR02574 family)
MSGDALLKEALQLSEDERIKLADALLSSVDDHVLTPEQQQELLRRQQELKANPQMGISWKQIKAE